MPENSQQTVINNGSISSSEIYVTNLQSSKNDYIQIYPITNELEIGDIHE